MRRAFFESLHDFYKENNRLYLLTADLGYKLFDGFKRTDPCRFYNMGISEANMIGVASGLAVCGNRAYCYSIVPFLTMRAFEQIRVDVDVHALNVRLVGVGGGFTYGFEGLTHYGLEDCALLASLPNMTIAMPADLYEAKSLAEASVRHEGPLYIRLPHKGAVKLEGPKEPFRIGRSLVLREGKRVALVTAGTMVESALGTLPLLAKKGIYPTVINVRTLKPLDRKTIIEVARRHDLIVSIEEHYTHGGLGSLVGELLLETRFRGVFLKVAIPCVHPKRIGNALHLRAVCGLTPESIARKVIHAL